MKKLLKYLCLCSLAILMLLNPMAAFATQAEPKPINGNVNLEYAKFVLKEKLISMGVEEDKIPGLIEKFEKGQTWDSMNPQYRNLEPQIKKDGYEKTTYPDGSILISQLREGIDTSSPTQNSQINLWDSLFIIKNPKEILKRKMLVAGVEEDKIPVLLNKYDKRQTWDSMKEEYKNIKPQIKKEGYEKTIYPDGSIKITRLVNDINSPSSTEMQDGQTKIGSVYGDYLMASIYYEVTYRQSSLTKEAQILSTQSFSVQTIGSTFTAEKGNHHLYGWRNPTHAWYAINTETKDGRLNERLWLKFYANGDKVWIEEK